MPKSVLCCELDKGKGEGIRKPQTLTTIVLCALHFWGGGLNWMLMGWSNSVYLTSLKENNFIQSFENVVS